jgi:predicted O-methyltransferase YrrM
MNNSENISRDEFMETYCTSHTSLQSELLAKIERNTFVELLHSHMISGAYQGRFLAMLSQIKKPNYILEIGTFTGYSALCLAEGLTENGKLITLENNPEMENRIRNNFAESPLGHKIELKIGHAKEIIPTLNSKFDLVFMDADKENYLNYYHLIQDKLAPKAIIIADNVLWKGKIIYDALDKKTKALQAFNNFVQKDEKVENILLPIRDGLMLIYLK